MGASHGDVEPDALLGPGGELVLLRSQALPVPHGNVHVHDGDVGAVVLVFDEPLDWLGFGVWLTMLLHARGGELLRVKGLVDVGADGPLLLDAVQHVVHPPRHLDAWPDDDRRSRLVLIGRGLDAAQLERSLLAFVAQ